MVLFMHQLLALQNKCDLQFTREPTICCVLVSIHLGRILFHTIMSLTINLLIMIEFLAPLAGYKFRMMQAEVSGVEN